MRNASEEGQHAEIRDGAASRGQCHRNAQPAGVGPCGHAQNQHTPVHDVQGCSYAGRRPFDSLAAIRAAHHSGVPCEEGNIFQYQHHTTPTNSLSYPPGKQKLNYRRVYAHH